jgi:hypothetical protein
VRDLDDCPTDEREECVKTGNGKLDPATKSRVRSIIRRARSEAVNAAANVSEVGLLSGERR